jgi:DNA-binding transcriptional LysR family regulator
MNLLDQMTTFVAVVEANSLSGAARKLHLSLPAVSRQLRALEEETGAVLLRRTTRTIALTQEGRTLYERALRILRDVDETRALLSPSREVRGTLVVSAPISIALSLVLPHLPGLAAKHPGLTIDLRLEDRLVDFVRDGVDVAIRGGALPPDSTSYVAHPLARFERWLVASPGYLKTRGTPRKPEDLARHACLVQVGAFGAMSTWRLVRGAREVVRSVVVSGPVLSNAPVALTQLARDGMGIALVADWLVAEDIGRGALGRVLPEWQSEGVAMWAICRVEQKTSPAVAAFMQALRPALHPGEAQGRPDSTRS